MGEAGHDTKCIQSADVAKDVEIWTRMADPVWANVQIRPGARIGRNCILGRHAFVDLDVDVGDTSRSRTTPRSTRASGVEDGVFIGPHVIFTNDKVPRAINPDGPLKTKDDWELGAHPCRGTARPSALDASS